VVSVTVNNHELSAAVTIGLLRAFARGGLSISCIVSDLDRLPVIFHGAIAQAFEVKDARQENVGPNLHRGLGGIAANRSVEILLCSFAVALFAGNQGQTIKRGSIGPVEIRKHLFKSSLSLLDVAGIESSLGLLQQIAGGIRNRRGSSLGNFGSRRGFLRNWNLVEGFLESLLFGLNLDASRHLRKVIMKSGFALLVSIERLVEVGRQQQTRSVKPVQSLPGARCGNPIHTKLESSNQRLDGHHAELRCI